MPRKEHCYHYLYKTTNMINGKYYVGMHSTSNLEDGYLGSGKRLRYAINKYGKENFNKEVLQFFKSREELIKGEIEMVNETLINDQLCMNLKPGGRGGFCNEEHKNKWIKTGQKIGLIVIKFKRQYDIVWIHKNALNMSKSIKLAIKKGNLKIPNWTGKKHKDATKLKMSLKAKLRIGDKNNMFNTCWIFNKTTNENKKIKKEELENNISLGWIKGRKMNMSLEISGYIDTLSR